MKVRFKRVHPNAEIPTKAHRTDAGFDLVATSRQFDELGNIVYGTGIAVEIPEGYAGLIFPRSSICKYDLALTNAVGVIDANYRGEITAKFKPSLRRSKFSGDGCSPVSPNLYEVGERIAQMVILPYPEIKFEETDTLTDTERGNGGYGSTGR